jgi:hypothetical protein
MRMQFNQKGSVDPKLMNEHEQLNNFINTLPFVMTKKSPFFSKAFVTSCLIFGVAGTLYSLSCYDLYTPQHTNAHYLYVSLLCHLGIVVSV